MAEASSSSSRSKEFEALARTLALGALAREPAERGRQTLGVEQWAQTVALQTGDLPPEALATDETLAQPSVAPSSAPAKLPALSLGADAGADLVPVRVLGEGGMGVVTLARQESLSREVAIKQVRPEARGPHSAQSLIVEATMTGSLEHPNIVPVHALGLDPAGAPALVMKRVEGVSWSALLEDPAHPAMRFLAGDDVGPGALSDGARLDAHLRVFTQLCNALHFAHSRGVIHRDLKPENVMIGSFGEVYLLDWGIAMRPAALTDAQRGSTLLAGTPCFMAPELVTGRADALGPHTDVYLLGATLHAVLTGQPRHLGATVHEVLLRAYESEPFAYGPTVPAELASLCNAATHRDPKQRPESALAVRHAVETFLRHRASIDTATGATAVLAAFEGSLPTAPLERDAQLRAQQAWQALTEARLGYAQALRGWVANAAAREGAKRCLTLLVERELALGNSEAASSLLDELGEPSDELRARAAALRAETLRLQQQDAQARREAFERDFTVSSRARALLFGGFATFVLVTGIPAAMRELRTGAVPDAHGQVYLDVVFILVLGGPTLVARRKLLVNRVARTLVFSMLLAALAGLTADLLSALMRLDGRTASIYSLTSIGCTLLGTLVWTQPRAAPAGAILIAAATLSALFPRGSTVFGVSAAVLSVATLIWASRTASDKAAVTAGAGS